ncbi:MAG TPA: bis(5'-nucleosyl)-tetraphosphatase (symmetrical) YqeK [Clostridiales bacterium]|nr:bis(5'-nucleosyl)-tetraphosphatase (symmetrical) YqeK [Clostridiales bacterium]
MTEQKEEWISLLQKKLKPARFRHSLNVADAAAELADRNGVDREKAYIAGLLHDIEKNAPPEEQKKYLYQLGDPVPRAVAENPKLWHGPAGACFIRDELGITDPEIISAIQYHTIGKKNMTKLEKIIYTADLISKERSYPDVDEVRAAALQNLDEGTFLGAQFTLQKLLAMRQPLNTDTLELYNQLAEEFLQEERT